MISEKKKAQAATWAINNRNTTNHLRNVTMKPIISVTDDEFEAKFILSTGNTRIWVMSAQLPDGKSVVSITDDFEANMLISPAEALTVAASLQAVAVHLMESEPRTLKRRTEPGAPAFEEGI